MTKTNSDYTQELMDAIEPFLQYYQKYPIGFAETNDLNDIKKCEDIVLTLLKDFEISYPYEKEQIIKREVEKWKDGKNGGVYGRYIARFLYLKTKDIVSSDELTQTV
jgi:hypothetical protein